MLERMKYVTKKIKVMRTTTTTQRTTADYGPELKLCGAQLKPSMKKTPIFSTSIYDHRVKSSREERFK